MFQGMASGASGMAGGLSITNASVEKTIDEPGEEIEDYPTRHYQLKSSWTATMAGSPMTTSFTHVEDIWVTTEITAGPATMALDQSAMPEAVKELAKSEGLDAIEGFVLRTVTVETMRSSMGMTGLGARMAERMMNNSMGGETTTTSEATDVEEIDIPPETFTIPAGFAETQLFQTGPAIPDLNAVPDESGAAATPVPDLNSIN
jgi:hypothetical protein